MTRAGVQALGLKLFAPAAPSAAATAVLAPEGISSSDIVKKFKADFGGILSDGQGDEMKGKIFRVAHVGYLDYIDTIGIVGGLEQVLERMRPGKFPLGTALDRGATRRPRLAGRKTRVSLRLRPHDFRVHRRPQRPCGRKRSRAMKIVAAEQISKNGLRLLAQQPGWEVIDPAQYAQSPDDPPRRRRRADRPLRRLRRCRACWKRPPSCA